MKYLIFSFLHSVVGAKRGVEFRYSTTKYHHNLVEIREFCGIPRKAEEEEINILKSFLYTVSLYIGPNSLIIFFVKIYLKNL